jgi:ABC-type amino acid transport substrate-binding protein
MPVTRIMPEAIRARLAGLFLALLTLLPVASAAPAPPDPAIALTAEERSFLAGRKIRVGVDSARPPFEYLDEQGAYSGISASFIKECARRLGVELVIVPGLTVAQAIAKVDADELDVVPKVTPTAARAQSVLFSEPYVTFPSVIISRKDARFISGLDDLQGLKVGVLKGLVVEELLRHDRPGLALLPAANIRDALLQLSTGKLDVFIDNLGTVSWNIDKLGLTNLRIAAPTPYNHDLAFAVRKDLPLLKSALDKALASMTGEERAAIKNRWLAISVQGVIDWQLVLPAGIALGAIILVILAWNRRLRRAIRERDHIQGELQAQARLLQAQAGRKARIAEIASGLQEAASFEILAATFLSQAAADTGLVVATLHALGRRSGRLRRIGAYGLAPTEEDPSALGHGLVGQCARSKAPLVITDPAGIPLRIELGRGSLTARELLVLPVQRAGRVLAVLSAATPSRFEPEQRAFLEELLPVLALNLELLEGHLQPEAEA